MTKVKNIVGKIDKSSQFFRKTISSSKHTVTNTVTNYGGDVIKGSKEFLSGHISSTTYSVSNTYLASVPRRDHLKTLQKDIENQGSAYREALRNRCIPDAIFLLGDSMSSLLSQVSVPPEIQAAYKEAYPNLAEEVGFLEHARHLSENQLSGFISGIKGKLFEQRYVDYLNDGVLPVGYEASLANTATQNAWDIVIGGPDGERARLLQAKATDSVGYVQDAIVSNPSIDVVTTSEVYSELMLAGVSDNVAHSNVSNEDITEYVESSIKDGSVGFEIAPPALTLAFIAFTSYRDEGLTYYEKARSAGERTGKAYLSYLIGGGVAVATNTWWLGPVVSVSSRYVSNLSQRKAELVRALRDAKETNQKVIDRVKGRRVPG